MTRTANTAKTANTTMRDLLAEIERTYPEAFLSSDGNIVLDDWATIDADPTGPGWTVRIFTYADWRHDPPATATDYRAWSVADVLARLALASVSDAHPVFRADRDQAYQRIASLL